MWSGQSRENVAVIRSPSPHQVFPGWLCTEADQHGDHSSAEEQSSSEVHVVDVGHNPRPVVFLHAQRGLKVQEMSEVEMEVWLAGGYLIGEVQDHPGHTNGQTKHESPEGSLVRDV